MASRAEEIWNKLTSGMQEQVSAKWWSELIKKYNENGRSYHNVDHLLDKFDHFETVKGTLKNPDAVAFAIFFHYFEYDPKSVECEAKNIEHFNSFVTESGIPKESPLCSEVVDLLQMAASHSTEEHKTSGMYGSEDCHYFLDIDMAVLGSNPEHYADYTTKVQHEYDFLPESMYRNLRLKVLQNFLQIPNIFATKEFRGKYESQARQNIQQEVEKLKL